MRARIFLGLALVAFLVAVFSLFVGSLALRNAPRVMSDLGAGSISIFSIVVAIIVSVTSLFREVEQKTIFPILARPVRRAEYIVGKYAGTLLTLLVFICADAGFVLMLVAKIAGTSALIAFGPGFAATAIMAFAAFRSSRARTYGVIPWAVVMLAIGVAVSGAAPDERRLMITSSLLTLLEVMIVTGFATLFASFSSPFLSALFSLWVFIVGRSADQMAHLPKKLLGPFLVDAFAVLAKIIPNLQIYVPARELLTGEAANADTWRYMLTAAGTSAAWAVGFVVAACLVFEKRDFL
ncbi:MAG: ABC transporter permease subunit [Polyangiaceae bacterium]